MNSREQILILCIALMGTFTSCNFYKKYNETKVELKAARDSIDAEVSGAFDDCKRIMHVESIMRRAEVCYGTIEVMCSGKSSCMSKYAKICQNGEYEQ